jgi:hypothetical protein
MHVHMVCVCVWVLFFYPLTFSKPMHHWTVACIPLMVHVPQFDKPCFILLGTGDLIITNYMLHGLPSTADTYSNPAIQDRTHLSKASFMSKAIILPVSTWNMYNILSTLASLPKEGLLRASMLLVVLHMWCSPPSAMWRSVSATVTFIPGKLT